VRWLGNGLIACALALFACGKSTLSPSGEGQPGAGAPSVGDAGAPSVEPQPFPPDQVSGTRFRARYWQLARDVRIADSLSGAVWFDTQLQNPCVWVPRGTEYRCELLGAFRLARLYSDSACTGANRVAEAVSLEPAISADGALPTPLSTPSLRDASCADKAYGQDGSGWFELGGQVPATSLYDGGAGCVPATLSSNAIVRGVGRKLSNEELGVARVERVDIGHRLGPVQIVAEDGARQRIAWHDGSLDADCAVGLAADGEMRCLPSTQAKSDGQWFTDSACKNGVVTLTGENATGAPPPFATVTEVSYDCAPDPTRVFRTGALVTGPLYFGLNGICTEVPAGMAEPATYALTEVLPEDMVAFERRTIGDRLQVNVLVSAEGALDAYPFSAAFTSPSDLGFEQGLTDTQLGQRCRLLATDGETRCLPEWSPQFPGMSCTRNVVGQVQFASACPQPPAPTFTAIWQGDSCQGGYAFAALGAHIQPNSGRVGDCLVGGSSSFFEVGAAVPLSTFQAVQLVTE
jgi:hypothetical protein